MAKQLTDKQRIDIVRYRIQNAKDTLAEIAIHRENGFYNTAVNRMYYACYYSVCAILIANGIETKTHEGVRQKLGQHFVITGKLSPELGRFYSRIFTKRSTGDYDDFISHDLDTVDNLYPKAQLFVSTIEQMVKEWLLNQESL